MDTPEFRYRNDCAYRAIVDQFEALIHSTTLAPSEVRECAMLACIHHEMRSMAMSPAELPTGVRSALEYIESWRMTGKEPA